MAMMETIGRQEEFVTSAVNQNKDDVKMDKYSQQIKSFHAEPKQEYWKRMTFQQKDQIQN